jgi:lipoprotein-anchoring transpeptidase ErfK/SrfK
VRAVSAIAVAFIVLTCQADSIFAQESRGYAPADKESAPRRLVGNAVQPTFVQKFKLRPSIPVTPEMSVTRAARDQPLPDMQRRDMGPQHGEATELPPRFRRTLVDYITSEHAGTLIIDTPNTYLYLVLGNGRAIRYGIGVGREGFTWAGLERITKMAEWPDWHPPAEMIERQPYLPRFMAGGEGNPLGARALYLGNTLYRIHGTNQPSTIGTVVSSGCIRLANPDIIDLYSRVRIGTRVAVLPTPARRQQLVARTVSFRLFEVSNSGYQLASRRL